VNEAEKEVANMKRIHWVTWDEFKNKMKSTFNKDLGNKIKDYFKSAFGR
jgi:hypothetical protein